MSNDGQTQPSHGQSSGPAPQTQLNRHISQLLSQQDAAQGLHAGPFLEALLRKLPSARQIMQQCGYAKPCQYFKHASPEVATVVKDGPHIKLYPADRRSQSGPGLASSLGHANVAHGDARWRSDSASPGSVAPRSTVEGGAETGHAPLNSTGPPLPPGKKPCFEYLRTGTCALGTKCKYHHPDAAGQDPVTSHGAEKIQRAVEAFRKCVMAVLEEHKAACSFDGCRFMQMLIRQDAGVQGYITEAGHKKLKQMLQRMPELVRICHEGLWMMIYPVRQPCSRVQDSQAQGLERHATGGCELGPEAEGPPSPNGSEEQDSKQQSMADGAQALQEGGVGQAGLTGLLREVVHWKDRGLLTFSEFEELKKRVIFQRSSIPNGLRDLVSWRDSQRLDSEQFEAAKQEMLLDTLSWPPRCVTQAEGANERVDSAALKIAPQEQPAGASVTSAQVLIASMKATLEGSSAEEAERLIAEVESAILPFRGLKPKRRVQGKLHDDSADLQAKPKETHASRREEPCLARAGVSAVKEEWDRLGDRMKTLQELCAKYDQIVPLREASLNAFLEFQQSQQGVREAVHSGVREELNQLTNQRQEAQHAALGSLKQWHSSLQDIMTRLQTLLPGTEQLRKHLAAALPSGELPLAGDDCRSVSMLSVAEKACEAVAAVDVCALATLCHHAWAAAAAHRPEAPQRGSVLGPGAAGDAWALLAFCLKGRAEEGSVRRLAVAMHCALDASRLVDDLLAEASRHAEEADRRLQALSPESPEGALQDMDEAQGQLKVAKRTLKDAKRQWEDAKEQVEDDADGGPAAVEAAEAAVRTARRQVQTEEGSLALAISRLWQLQEVHFPELLVRLEERIASRAMRDALQALKAPDRAKVNTMLLTDRKIEYYGDLEELGGRHEVFRSVYNDCACVLKKLLLVSESGLKSFVREVRNLTKFSRASNLYIVPLRGFFVEGKHGYLHFDEYPSDLEAWALAHVGLPIQRLLRAAHHLVSAVQYIHEVNFVHGDLKPKNVLMDGNSRPLLCDFEFGREQHGSATSPSGTTSILIGWSDGFVAPELCCGSFRDPQKLSTAASDVFALGRTLHLLLESAKPVGDPSQLEALIARMLQEDPGKRISAAEAVEDIAFAGLDAGVRAPEAAQPNLSPPGYWSFQQLDQPFHIVAPTKYMKERIELAFFATDHCGKLGRATVVSVRRIETQWLWVAYAAKREKMRAQIRQRRGSAEAPPAPSAKSPPLAMLDKEVNEVFLWHGCSEEAWKSIAQDGFDERLAYRNCLYGEGTYFTPQACKAMQYARAAGCSYQSKRCSTFYCTCPGPKFLLYSRVCLGVPYYATGPMKGTRRPPRQQAAAGAALFDSVMANPGVPKGQGKGFQEHQECVVWNHAGMQAYAEFVVELEYHG